MLNSYKDREEASLVSNPFDFNKMRQVNPGGGWWLFVRQSDPLDEQAITKREIISRFVLLIKMMGSGQLIPSDFSFSPPRAPGHVWVMTVKGKVNPNAPTDIPTVAGRSETPPGSAVTAPESGTTADSEEGSLFFS